MAWAIIGSDNAWVSGPLDDEPQTSDGQRAVMICAGYPDTVAWDAAAGGFVDRVPIAPVVDYLGLYTFDEIAAAWTKGMTDGRVAALLILTACRGPVDLTDPNTIGGIDYLHAVGVLTADRAARIKTGQPPA